MPTHWQFRSKKTRAPVRAFPRCDLTTLATRSRAFQSRWQNSSGSTPSGGRPAASGPPVLGPRPVKLHGATACRRIFPASSRRRKRFRDAIPTAAVGRQPVRLLCVAASSHKERRQARAARNARRSRVASETSSTGISGDECPRSCPSTPRETRRFWPRSLGPAHLRLHFHHLSRLDRPAATRLQLARPRLPGSTSHPRYASES